tara:strand:- start:4447 stop:4707 length:261 start_codon:yes stop_codon:yes gene_type:complete
MLTRFDFTEETRDLLELSLESGLVDVLSLVALGSSHDSPRAIIDEIYEYIGARQHDRGGDFDSWRGPLIDHANAATMAEKLVQDCL